MSPRILTSHPVHQTKLQPIHCWTRSTLIKTAEQTFGLEDFPAFRNLFLLGVFVRRTPQFIFITDLLCFCYDKQLSMCYVMFEKHQDSYYSGIKDLTFYFRHYLCSQFIIQIQQCLFKQNVTKYKHADLYKACVIYQKNAGGEKI